MSDNNGWPDPARPGVPLNPEREGWHWLKTGRDGLTPWYWVEDQDNEGCFGWETEDDIYSAETMAFKGTSYLVPCLTPAEVDARVKQARRDALEEAALAAENEPEPEGDPPPELHGRSVKNIATASVRATKRSIAAAIRALKGEGDE